MNLVIPDEILQSAHISVAKVKQEIAFLFWQKQYATLEQASTLAEIGSFEFQQRLAKNKVENRFVDESSKEQMTSQDGEHVNQLMRDDEMIVLSRKEWERFMALQENPPKPNEKLKQLMQKEPLIYDREIQMESRGSEQ